MQIASRRGGGTGLRSCVLLALTALCFLPLVVRVASPATADFVRISPDFAELNSFGEHARTYRTMLICFQLAAILATAKLAGWACETIRVPGVIGELLAGVVIGPFLLGSIIQVPIEHYWIPLFPKPFSTDQCPVNDVVWALSQFA